MKSKERMVQKDEKINMFQRGLKSLHTVFLTKPDDVLSVACKMKPGYSPV